MIPAIIFSLLFIILAIVFYLGKGDKLIAGYNTASEEERKKVNIQRPAFCVSMPIVGNKIQAQLGAAAVFMAVIIFVVILANTWAKKK